MLEEEKEEASGLQGPEGQHCDGRPWLFWGSLGTLERGCVSQISGATRRKGHEEMERMMGYQ
jgi:hypothetical protein